MLRVRITDILGITNIANIADITDIAIGIADIITDIADIVMDIAGIADQVLRTLRWKQVGVYKVSWGCPVTKKLYKLTSSLFLKAIMLYYCAYNTRKSIYISNII